MRYKKTLLLFMICMTLFLSFLAVGRVRGALADISYDLEKDIFYNSNETNFNESSFNLRNPIIYSENYSASYSFENDTVGSVPEHFTEYEGSGSEVGVVSNLDGHNKVVELNTTTTGAGDRSELNQGFESTQTYGTVEFWFRSTNVDATHANYFRIYDGGTYIVYGYAQTDKFRYFDGAHKDIPNVNIPLDDVWFHIRIDFELTAGSYLGMAQYRCIITINGISSGVLSLPNNQPSADSVFFGNTDSHANYGQFIDGLGYSWLSNYTIRDNLFPDSEVNSNSSEVDRYEFALTDINTFNPYLQDNPNGWTDIELPSGDKVGIVDEVDGSFDKLISISSAVSGDNRGIEKADFNINGTFINITFGFIPMSYVGISNQFYMKVYSSTDVLSTQLFVDADLSIYYSHFSGSVDTGIDVQEGTAFRYELNVLMDYEINRAFLIIRENDIVLGIFDYTLMNVGHEGVGIITIKETIVANELMFTFIDYVGIYSHGISQVESEKAFGIVDITFGSNWNFEHNNLMRLISNGTFHLGVISGNYTDSSSLAQLRDTYTYNNTLRFQNIYDIFDADIVNAHLLITVIDKYYDFSYFYVEGAKLTEGVNEYFLEYSHSGNHYTNESYFYVDLDNKLQFYHIANDTDLEYIQAEFNINDISSTDYAIKFKSNIDNNAEGYFRVNFTAVSNIIPLPIFDTTTRIFITQNRTISSFIIRITDDDIDAIQGTTEGYVSEIELLYVVGIGVSITTSNLLTVIIPIIIIFIPTFLLSSRIGKNMIVPLMMLMSLICVATEIIPVWLFFVIIFPASLFLFLKRREGLI